jgi:D-3-phosphoglycerate dehydrogenase
MTKILLTTTSFQDTPGEHHKLLADTGWEIIRARGPLNEADTLALVGDIDGYICGDDMITRQVLEKALPKLKVLSKYGIGVDKIDVKSCTEFGIPLLFTPGVNHTTVAEHCFLLLLALEKNLLFHTDSTRANGWKRKTGHELLEKTIGIIGLGRIGKEVAIRARAFGMNVIAHDIYWDEKFAAAHNVKRAANLDEIYAASDYISLHTNLTPETRDMVSAKSSIAEDEKGRDHHQLRARRDRPHRRPGRRSAIRPSRRLRHRRPGRGAAAPNHPLLKLPNCICTPAHRLAHLRERRPPSHRRREKPHPRDARRETPRPNQPRGAG